MNDGADPGEAVDHDPNERAVAQPEEIRLIGRLWIIGWLLRRILERGLRKALTERDEALRDLAAAARWVDRSAFGKEEGFGQAHQALLKALEKAGCFV